MPTFCIEGRLRSYWFWHRILVTIKHGPCSEPQTETGLRFILWNPRHDRNPDFGRGGVFWRAVFFSPLLHKLRITLSLSEAPHASLSWFDWGNLWQHFLVKQAPGASILVIGKNNNNKKVARYPWRDGDPGMWVSRAVVASYLPQRHLVVFERELTRP